MDSVQTIDQVIDQAPQNTIIQSTMMKMHLKLDHYKDPVCSVSGGSDSDTMMDLIERVRMGRPITYVFFDTGIEYQATHRHLDKLETKYNVKIVRRKATIPVPKACQQHGVPFLSKEASDKIKRLQRHGFKFEDKAINVLLGEYPRCRAGVEWWCNARGNQYGIGQYKYLKEFMTAFPPLMSISDKCCECAKKDPSKLFHSECKTKMKILGLRQTEGGVRSTSFTSCFSVPDYNDIANYRPLWFWTDTDKAKYKKFYGLTYSDCYEVWGFKRTGCAGCPFNSYFEDDLLIMQQYEPQMYLAANNIFGASYDYTRAYRQYKAGRVKRDKLNGQMVLGEDTT